MRVFSIPSRLEGPKLASPCVWSQTFNFQTPSYFTPPNRTQSEYYPLLESGRDRPDFGKKWRKSLSDEVEFSRVPWIRQFDSKWFPPFQLAWCATVKTCIYLRRLGYAWKSSWRLSATSLQTKWQFSSDNWTDRDAWAFLSGLLSGILFGQSLHDWWAYGQQLQFLWGLRLRVDGLVGNSIQAEIRQQFWLCLLFQLSKSFGCNKNRREWIFDFWRLS